jgi:hypothetical protein
VIPRHPAIGQTIAHAHAVFVIVVVGWRRWERGIIGGEGMRVQREGERGIKGERQEEEGSAHVPKKGSFR